MSLSFLIVPDGCERPALDVGVESETKQAEKRTIGVWCGEALLTQRVVGRALGGSRPGH